MPEYMKAAVCRRYGPPDVLQLMDVEKPVPGDNDVLIKVHAVAVTTEDPLNRRGKPYILRVFTGLRRPKTPIQGAEFAGEVEAVGNAVRRFKKGDQVFGSTGTGFGCYAEYVCMPEEGFLAIKPASMTYSEAAPVCAALAAWNFLREMAHMQRGHKVLINGASGAVGTAAVQLAKHFGADVTGVCSTANVELVRSLGADTVIDYTTEDFTKSGEAYDIILELSGKRSFARCKGSLAHNGIYISALFGLGIVLHMMWTAAFGTKKAKFSATGLLPVRKRLHVLTELIALFEAGTLQTVIDRRYALGDIVAAHRYVEEGHKTGNVVITREHHTSTD